MTSLSSGILWLASQTVARQIVSFIVFIILGRLLSPTDFGVVSLSTSVLVILQSFASQGIAQAVIQMPNLTDIEANVAYTLNFLISLVAFTLLSLVSLSAYLSNRELFWIVLPIVGLSLPISALYQIQQSRLMRSFNFFVVAKKTVLAQLFGGAVGILCALLGLGVWSLVAQQFVVLATEFWIVRRASTWTPKFSTERNVVRQIARFSAYLFGARFLAVIQGRGTDIVLGIFQGQTAVGFFRIASTMLEVTLTTFAEPIQALSLPLFSSKQARPADVLRSYLQMSEAMAWLVLPPFLTLVIWAPSFIEALFGAKWQSSGWILQILATKVALYAMLNLNEPLLVALGHTREVFRIRCWQTGLGIGSILIAAPFGFIPIVVAQVVGTYLAAPIMFMYVARAVSLDVPRFFLIFWKPFLSATVFVGMAVALKKFIVGGNFFALLAVLSFSYIVYWILFFWGAAPEIRGGVIGIIGRVLSRPKFI